MDRDEAGTGAPEVEELADIVRRLREDLDLLREAALQRRDELVGRARGFIAEHPFAAVGAGVAIGYLLAGGIFSRATMRIARVGARIYLGRLLRDAVIPGIDVLRGDGTRAPHGTH